MMTDRWLVELQDVSILADEDHVLQCLERGASSDDSPGPTVVGGQRVVLSFEPADHLGQILDATLDVGLDPERPKRGRHDLEVASSPDRGTQAGVATGFVEADCSGQRGIHVVLCRVHGDVVFDLHHLAIHAQKPGRELLERNQLGGVLSRSGGYGRWQADQEGDTHDQRRQMASQRITHKDILALNHRAVRLKTLKHKADMATFESARPFRTTSTRGDDLEFSRWSESERS